MSRYREHRIYKTLAEPLRFLGLTMDELALGVIGFLGTMLSTNSFYWKGFFILFGFGGIVALKKIKKRQATFHLRSVLVWYGWLPKPSSSYPSSLNRFYLP